MKVMFRDIRWKNFISSGNNWIKIQLDKEPNTLVVGENGSGKSTVLDALTFVLFGKPFRKVNRPQLVNSINDGDCLVELDFDIGTNKYMVRRGIKPAVFEIELNGKPLSKLAHAKDFQSLLESQILKLNYKSFTQVVILGSSTFVPFMQLTPSNRREVIEDLLDIGIFSHMNNILKQQISDTKDITKDTDSDIALEEQMVTVQSKNLKRIEKDSQKTIDRHQEDIDKLIGDNAERATLRDAHQKVVVPLVANTANAPVHKTKQAGIEKVDHKLQNRQTVLEREIAFYNDNDDCPTCEQDIDEHFKNGAVVSKTVKLEEVIEGRTKLLDMLTDIGDTIDHDNQMLGALSDLQTQIGVLETQISANQTIINSLTDSIADLSSKEDLTKTKADIQTARDNLKGLELTKEALTNTAATQRLATMLLKDTGIKTVIIRQYLPIINKLINQYLADMEFFISFNLDESFDETIKSRHRDKFSYASFSEGEKMRIDLALLFTWRHVAKLKNSTNTNLLILDEVFDSSLDDAGTQEFMKILHTLKDTNCFVISHKGDILQDKFNHIIKFEKVKGFSRIS